VFIANPSINTATAASPLAYGGHAKTAANLEANEYFVDMHELIEAAGPRVAELMGAEAAIVTSGGFASLLLGAAATSTVFRDPAARASVASVV